VVNPYESPVAVSPAKERKAVIWHCRGRRLFFCLLNFSLAVLFAALGLWAFLARPAHSFGFETLLWSATVLYAALELTAIFLPPVERYLGFAILALGALFCIGLVTTTYREVSRPSEYLILLPVYVLISAGVAAYLLSCGWTRVRLKTRPRS
jgi:uncharacterized membrane protein AbrB (regulator of aidB expression)